MTKCYMWKILRSSQKDSPRTNKGDQCGSSIPAQNRKPIVSTYFPWTHGKKKNSSHDCTQNNKILRKKNSRKEDSLYTRNNKTLWREFKDLWKWGSTLCPRTWQLNTGSVKRCRHFLPKPGSSELNLRLTPRAQQLHSQGLAQGRWNGHTAANETLRTAACSQ